jgi:RNA polymerase sigma factor (sigma-70 family)
MGVDEGREDRFRALYEKGVEPVARYAARRVPTGDVHDVVSETFLVAWRRFDDVPADPLPWLFGTARRVIANRRRATTRRNALGVKLAGEAETNRRVVEPAGVDDALLAAIGQLPDAEREALLLVAWDGLDAAGASAAAGCSRATFRMRLHRARRRLARRLVPEPASPVDSRTRMEELQ